MKKELKIHSKSIVFGPFNFLFVQFIVLSSLAKKFNFVILTYVSIYRTATVLLEFELAVQFPEIFQVPRFTYVTFCDVFTPQDF